MSGQEIGAMFREATDEAFAAFLRRLEENKPKLEPDVLLEFAFKRAFMTGVVWQLEKQAAAEKLRREAKKRHPNG